MLKMRDDEERRREESKAPYLPQLADHLIESIGVRECPPDSRQFSSILHSEVLPAGMNVDMVVEVSSNTFAWDWDPGLVATLWLEHGGDCTQIASDAVHIAYAQQTGGSIGSWETLTPGKDFSNREDIEKVSAY
jgi:hypothetical protein